MVRIFELAGNTFRETIRDRVLNSSLLFAIALIAASVLLGQLSIGQDQKIVRDLGLGAIEVFSVIIAIFIGTSLLHRELDKRTIFIVLSKPVSRAEFLIGKFTGLMGTLTVLLLAMALAFSLLLVALKAFDPLLLWQVGLIWVQLGLLVATALLFSTFTSPVLAMMYCFSLYVVGHNLGALRLVFQTEAANPLLRALAKGLYFGLPNLAHLDVKNQVVYGVPFSAGEWLQALAYGGAYAAAALAIGVAVFSRREM